MKRYRYYVTQRPPEPGAVPEDDKVIDSECYDQRILINRAGEAWGWVEYDHPLTPRQISDYELTEETFPFEITFDDGTTGRVYTTDEIAHEMRTAWKVRLRKLN